MDNLTVGKIMTPQPITIRAEDTVVYAAKILADHNFNGLPVVDNDGTLIGIITEYDLVSKGSDLHLPTLISILGNVGVYQKDSGPIKDNLKKLLSLQVKDIMNNDPLTISQDAFIQDLSDLFAHHHKVNPIPVVDAQKRLVGIVSRFDLVRLYADGTTARTTATDQSAITDQKVDQFVQDFEQRFVFVSRNRARLWPYIAAAFGIVGFVIAFAIILRIATK